MTDAKWESIEKQRKWYAKNVNTFLDTILDIIYADEEMIVILESGFMVVVIKGKGRCHRMTINEAVECLRKEKVCRTLDATTCLLNLLKLKSSCDKCEYNIDESVLTEALCVVVSYFDKIDI